MKFRIVTLNVKIDSPEGFAKRLPLIIEKINYESPYVICFQEMSDAMCSQIMEGLPQYAFVGGGRNTDRLGEGTPIAYMKGKILISEFHTRWLSDKPYVPASTFGGDQSGCPRIYTFGLFTHTESRLTFRIYNTHFDHVGSKARFKEAKMLKKEIIADSSFFPYPYILCGDLNAMPNTREIKHISDSDGFNDLTDGFVQTFNNFGKEINFETESKIDYIFVSNEIKCRECHLWCEDKDGLYLSDHYGISADLELDI